MQKRNSDWYQVDWTRVILDSNIEFLSRIDKRNAKRRIRGKKWQEQLAAFKKGVLSVRQSTKETH